MPLLEALASGKPVIAPPIGFVPEFPHIEYEAGNFEQMRNRIEALVQERCELRRSVEQRTWLRWAMDHHRLFRELLPPDMAQAMGLRARNTSAATASMPPMDMMPLVNKMSDNRRVLVKTPDPLRILLVARKEQLAGGPLIRIPILRQQLTDLGHSVDVSYDPTPQTAGFDIAHVFNVWTPWEALRQIRHLKQTGIPVVLSPIFLDLAESAWAAKAVMLIFTNNNDTATREKFLDALADGSLMLDNKSRAQGVEIFPGGNAMIREIIMLADHLITLSTEEMQRIAKCCALVHKPFTLVRNAADYAAFENRHPVVRVKVWIKRFCPVRRQNRASQKPGAAPGGAAGERTNARVCRSVRRARL